MTPSASSTASGSAGAGGVASETTVGRASFQALAPLSVEVPEYDTTDTTDRKIASFQGYSSVTAVPVTMLLQNANSGNSASAVVLRMKSP